MLIAELLMRLVGWSANLLLLLTLSLLLYRPLKTNKPSLDAPLLLFLWIFVTSAVMLLFGLAGLLEFRWLIGATVAGWLLLLLPAWRKNLWKAWHEFADLWVAAQSVWQSLPRWLRWFSVAALGLSFIRFGFLIWALPPFVWDSLTYHLTNVAHWIQAGRIELFDTPMIRIYTPANYELLAAWFAVFIHHDAVIEAAGLPAYILATMAVYAGLRGLHLRRSSSLMAALSYASMPGFLIAVTGTKNDPHMASYYLLALALVISLFSGDDRPANRKSLPKLISLALVLLLAAGTKAYIAHIFPGLLLAALLMRLIGEGGVSFSAIWHSARQNWRSWSSAVQWILVLLILAGVFLGGYWNIRNWLLKGNPFYPYGVSIEGNQLLAEGDRTARLTFDRLAENVQLLVDRFWDRKEPIRPDLPYSTGWGWFAYGLGLPAFFWGLLRRKKFWPIAVGFVVSWLTLMLSTRPSPWNMRYAIWFPAIFSYAFGLFVEAMISQDKWLRWSVGFLFTGTLAMNFVLTLNYNRVSADKFELMMERSVWNRHASVLKLNMPAQYENALVYVPEGEKLGYNVGSNGFIYPLFKADFSQEIVYIPFAVDDSCGEIAERMEQKGVRYLFVAPEHTSDQKIAHLRYCGDNQTEIRERARGLYVLR